jgi:hypothetical protein
MEEQQEVEIWHKPMLPAAVIVDKVQQELVNMPEEFEVTIKLSGIGAKRYNLISKILEIGFQEEPSVISNYLLRAGVERELNKVLSIINNLPEETEIHVER